MKKLIYTSLLLFLFISSKENLYSQSGWFWQNPLPVGSNLEDVFFVNSITGYAVGWNGTILKTVNGGLNWIQLNSGMNVFFYSTHFINADTGFVVSGDVSYPTFGYILKTTNGGLNWNVSPFVNECFRSIYFINSHTGYACGIYGTVNGTIYKTTNAGENWNKLVNLPQSFYTSYTSIYFENINTGFISNEQCLLKTTNNGQNWLLKGYGILTGIQDIYFLSIDTGFAVGMNGKIFKTTDSGLSWIQINSGVSTHLWSIKFINKLTGFITGGGTLQLIDGKFLKTTDGGNSWLSLNYGSTQNLYGLSTLNDSGGITVGNCGSVFKYTGYGNSWNQISYSLTSENLNSVYFANSNTGFISGSNGSFYKSTNSGINWTQYSLNTTKNINNCTFINSFTGFLIGNEGIILRTTNTGENWLPVTSGTNYNLSDIYFPNENTGFITGYYETGFPGFIHYGTILKTTNYGNNWNSVLNTNYDMNCIRFIDNNTGYSSGRLWYANRTFRTTNGGLNWSSINIDSTSDFKSIYFINSNTGFIGGKKVQQTNSYSLYKTTNRGINWSYVYIPISYNIDLKSIYFINENTGFIASLSFSQYHGRSGDVFKTTNCGLNWYHFSTFSSYPTIQWYGLNSIFFSNSNTGFVVGEHGTVLKTTNGGNLINIEKYTRMISRDFSLSQNYPNPFNPSTTIKFDIPKSTHVQIVVYDLLGREVEQLLNEERKPGSYEVTWDGSRYSSGVYFYKIIADDFIETKKMILIK